MSDITPVIPHNPEAEGAVLGAVLINPDCYHEVARVLKAEDFYIHRNGWVWETFVTLTNSRRAIDLLTVQNELEKRDVLAEVGGSAYLTKIINSTYDSANALEYAGIVREYAERRNGIRLANRIAQSAYDDSTPFLLNEHAMSALSIARHDSRRMDTTDAASEMIDLMESPRFFTTGIADVDEKIGGLFPEELSVLAGYQGTGKSAEKIQAARRNAEAGRRVLLVDLEMSAAQTWFRMACGDLGIDVNRVRSDRVNSETKGEIINHAAELGEKYKGRIVIYQAPMSPADILSAAMLEQPDIVFVDVLKNVSGKSNKESVRDWYDYALNFLRINVAQRLKCHVQVLHHISRESFKGGRKPTMHDLMFAGESDADAIFLLYRKSEDYENGKEIVPVTWITDKSRFGWTGEEEVNYRLTTQQFYGMSRKGF